MPKKCLRMFKEINIHFNTKQVGSCCKTLLPEVNTDDILNSPQFLDFKSSLLKGDLPSACKYCISQEKSSARPSHRQEGNKLHLKYQLEENSILEDSEELLISDPNTAFLTLTGTCNLKCVYCRPELSSKWRSEMDSYGPFALTSDVNWYNNYSLGKSRIYEERENTSLRLFIEDFPRIYPGLRNLTLSGGEPVMSKVFWTFLDYIKNNPNEKLNLFIPTNMMFGEKLLSELIKELRHIENGFVNKLIVTPSIDTQGKRAEYIRTGLDYELFFKNLDVLIRNTKETIFNFNITVNALSISRKVELLRDLQSFRRKYKNREFRLSFNVLHTPDFLSPDIHDNERIGEYLIKFKEFMQGEFKDDFIVSSGTHMRVIDTFLSKAEELERKRMDFRLFIDQLDRRRGTDFKSIFPEFEYLI